MTTQALLQVRFEVHIPYRFPPSSSSSLITNFHHFHQNYPRFPCPCPCPRPRPRPRPPCLRPILVLVLVLVFLTFLNSQIRSQGPGEEEGETLIGARRDIGEPGDVQISSSIVRKARSELNSGL
eukprot:93518-Hanusia_phi.AAC.1